MRNTVHPASSAKPTAGIKWPLILGAFVTTIFVSAGLLFAVQPMFTKMVLPKLGGAAAVWSMAMVFFQTTLFAGYAYANLLTRFAPGRSAVFIQLAVMIVACFALPLHIAAGWTKPPPFTEAQWVLDLFAASIGLPFFALSANGPLLQAWFSRTAHPAAKDPYFLFAASNAGSFLVLAAYPTLFEPNALLSEQTWFWTGGYYLLILLIAGCGALMMRFPSALPNATISDGDSSIATSLYDILRWIGLAAVPSGLLLAVTAFISTDIAAVPLLWAVPLGLYLLAFVIAFQTRPLIPHWLVVEVAPYSIVALVAIILASPISSPVFIIGVHLFVFSVVTLLCHGELAERRPPPRLLTAYYMWISAGGVIGGISVGLLAPQLFNWVAEYPILIAFSVLCLPGLMVPGRATSQSPLFAALAGLTLLMLILPIFGLNLPTNLMILVLGALLGLTACYWRSPLPFAAILLFVLVSTHYYFEDTGRSYIVRNFFGVLNAAETENGKFRVLWHGGTAQGAQRIRGDDGNLLTGRPKLISEFFDGAGIAQTFAAVHARVNGPIDYAVIGLGTGAMACFSRPNDKATYYELDPDIIEIAQNSKLFSFLTECGANTRIAQGDARITLDGTPPDSYDLIFVDAFLGAAIPVHLLTREAMALYFSKLKPHGIVAMHVSNYSLELGSVVAGIAQANNAITRYYEGGDVQSNEREMTSIPMVAVVARSDDDFGVLAQSKFWPILDRDSDQRIWTDDYSNVAGAVLRKLKKQLTIKAE